MEIFSKTEENKIGTPIEVFDSPNFLPSKDNRKFNLLRSLAYNTLLVDLNVEYTHDTAITAFSLGSLDQWAFLPSSREPPSQTGQHP